MKQLKSLNKAVQKEENFQETKKSEKKYSIPLRIHELLNQKLHDCVNSKISSGDYTYPTVSDIFVMSLKSYKNGMQLTEPAIRGEKVATSMRVNKELYDFYKSFPSRKKTEIIERAIRTFLKENF